MLYFEIWIISGIFQSGLKLILLVEYDGHIIFLDDLQHHNNMC